MSGQQDGFLTEKQFGLWTLFLVDVQYKNNFYINLSTTTINNLNVMAELSNYQIQFDKYLVTAPDSKKIEIDKHKANLPIAYFAYIIDQAEKKQCLIQLTRTETSYQFDFTFY